MAENKYYSHGSSEEMWTSFERNIYIYIYINKITELKQDIYNMKIPSKVILLLYMNTPL